MVLTNQLIYLLSKRQNHEEDFFKLCVLIKKSELYACQNHVCSWSVQLFAFNLKTTNL